MSVRIENQNTLAILTIADADAGWTPAHMVALHEALRQADAADSVSVVLVRAEGAFGAAASSDVRRARWMREQDVREKVRAVAYPETAEPPSLDVGFSRLFRWRMSKPVVAAVRGDCFDHALAFLGLHTDVRLAERGARFGFPGIHEGYGSGLALVSNLAKQIPGVWLNWLVETGLPFSAEEAYARHLINGVTEVSRLDSEALALASRMAEAPAAALRAEKLAATELADLPWESGARQAGILAALAYRA